MNQRSTSLVFSAAIGAALIIAAAPAAHAQIVQNGGFETGDFTGFTQSGNTASSFVRSNTTPTPAGPLSSRPGPNSGTYYGSFGPGGSLGFLTQNVTLTVGQTYTLSFFLQYTGDTPANSTPLTSRFTASVNGVTLFDTAQPDPTANIPQQPYTRYQFNFIATAASEPLQFGFQSNPSQVNIDDISIVQGTPGAAPEPGSVALLFAGGLPLAGLIIRRRYGA